jgi:hypothetical protein
MALQEGSCPNSAPPFLEKLRGGCQLPCSPLTSAGRGSGVCFKASKMPLAPTGCTQSYSQKSPNLHKLTVPSSNQISVLLPAPGSLLHWTSSLFL